MVPLCMLACGSVPDGLIERIRFFIPADNHMEMPTILAWNTVFKSGLHCLFPLIIIYRNVYRSFCLLCRHGAPKIRLNLSNRAYPCSRWDLVLIGAYNLHLSDTGSVDSDNRSISFRGCVLLPSFFTHPLYIT